MGDTIVWHSYADPPVTAPADNLAYFWPLTVWFTRAGGPITKLREGPDRLQYAEPVDTGIVALWLEPQDASASIARLVHVDWPPAADGGADAAPADAQ